MYGTGSVTCGPAGQITKEEARGGEEACGGQAEAFVTVGDTVVCDAEGLREALQGVRYVPGVAGYDVRATEWGVCVSCTVGWRPPAAPGYTHWTMCEAPAACPRLQSFCTGAWGTPSLPGYMRCCKNISGRMMRLVMLCDIT